MSLWYHLNVLCLQGDLNECAEASLSQWWMPFYNTIFQVSLLQQLNKPFLWGYLSDEHAKASPVSVMNSLSKATLQEKTIELT